MQSSYKTLICVFVDGCYEKLVQKQHRKQWNSLLEELSPSV